MNSQELFTIDENTGEIIPIVQSTQQPQIEQPQIQQSQIKNSLGTQLPQNVPRQIQSSNNIRNNQVTFRQNQIQQQRPQQKIQVPVSLPKPVQYQSQNQQSQLLQSVTPNVSQQNNVSYKNWKNTNMNQFNKMVQPSNNVFQHNTLQTSNNLSNFRQQPVFNQTTQSINTQFVQQQNNPTVENTVSSDNESSQDMYQFDENKLYEQSQPIQQSNRLRNGSFIGKTNVQTNYNVNCLPKGVSLAIRKARTGKNSEDIYL